MNTRQLSRRHFLSRTAGLAATTFAGPNLLLRGQDAASKRLNLAIIGANGKGQSDTQAVTLAHNIVALVDVDSKRLEEAAKRREKIHAESNAAAPNVPKLLAAMHAIKHGKHVCVQKPLCNYIGEVRVLHQAAKNAKIVTQMGNQGRTMEGQRLAKEWIEQGVIGTLKEIRLWTNRPVWPQGPIKKKLVECPTNLDWDLWLSSEPSEPYFEFDLDEATAKKNKRSPGPHNFNWRGWWQFGSGALGDMGCHIMDATFSILGQLIPEKIDAESGPITALNAPAWSKLVYHMPAGKHPALKVSWHDGKIDGQPNKPERHPDIPVDT
ncbi:MAG: gfo/Idh/MocA family oxidoreductase, partial [Verrucomicrobiaceae bacterium]|nr:gfo/Idh/MocA family oxidoreductase [Verrucomicrobiaceae bacterium]